MYPTPMHGEIRNMFRGTYYIYPPFNNYCIYHRFRIVYFMLYRSSRPEGSDQTNSAMTRENNTRRTIN